MRSTKKHVATTVPTVPAAMQALLHERAREAAEPADGRREGMPAALQARDNLRRRLEVRG